MINQDTFVATIAILLGIGSLAAAISGGRLVKWSGTAQRLERLGGKITLIVFYAALGLFLLGVGISLLN